MSEASRHEVIQELRDRLRQLEQAQRPAREPALTGTVLDRVLPGQGLKWGSVIEWLSAGEGAGAATLALAGTAGLLRGGGALVVVDGKGEFYPPAAAGLGIDLA